MASHPATWLRPLPQGLFCEPGGFFIDPARAVDRAVITHAHSDHARPGHGHVLAHPDTLALMRARLGETRAGATHQALGWGEAIVQGGVRISLSPAGHVRGSAQVVLDYAGRRVVVSGDYKRQPDPTCDPFIPVRCDVFVTEATFALPVFRFPDPAGEIARVLASLAAEPRRTHLIACYSLRKCQRVIALLRAAGWDGPIHLHRAHQVMCATYEALGVSLGRLVPATEAPAGAIVLAPPGVAGNGWARGQADPVVAVASGWMALRGRARGVEAPLVISDHADWDGLLTTIGETEAPEIWITHGPEDALIHVLAQRGLRGRALRMVGDGEAMEPAAGAA